MHGNWCQADQHGDGQPSDERGLVASGSELDEQTTDSNDCPHQVGTEDPQPVCTGQVTLGRHGVNEWSAQQRADRSSDVDRDRGGKHRHTRDPVCVVAVGGEWTVGGKLQVW